MLRPDVAIFSSGRSKIFLGRENSADNANFNGRPYLIFPKVVVILQKNKDSHNGSLADMSCICNDCDRRMKKNKVIAI